AASRLPPDLLSKDWKLTVSGADLVLKAGQSELSAQELLTLRAAFSGGSVESEAKQVAAAMISIAQMKKAGADPDSLAWVRIDVDAENFDQKVDLRAFVTSTAPGSLSHQNAALPDSHLPVPPVLGGMDFRELVTTRPRFLRADGSVNPEAMRDFE